jgi:hypothetical protein
MARFERGQIGHQSLAADIEQAGEHIVAARRDLTWEAPETETSLLNRENGHCCVNLEVGDGARLGRHSVA